MSEGRSKRMETEDLSRVHNLLGLLSDLSQQDPSPAVRERLSTLASQRLKGNPGYPARLRHRPFAWLKPTLAAACLVAVGLATVLAVHFVQHRPAQTGKAAKVNPPAISLRNGVHGVPATQSSIAKAAKVHYPRPAPAHPASVRGMTMRLPYSNSAIETGTDAIIRVSMSQSELLSLGFPINATVQDRRVVAELTLGDDGLPRAISLPLPLEVIKEKK